MGKVTKTTDFNKTKDEKLEVFCSQCRRETNHVVLQSVDYSGSEVYVYYDGHPITIDWSNHYQIIQCQGCETISFRHVSWFSEAMQQIGPDEYDDGTSMWLYPRRSSKTRPIRGYYNVPNTLRRIYRETIDCFNNESNTLCAAGLRAIVEGICADQKVTDGPVEEKKKDGNTKVARKNTLQGKIAGLFEKGILTKSNATVLHEHRYLGNEAVHELSQPSADELALAIEIMEHTLDALYELPDKADELRHKKAARQRKHNK